MALPAAPTVNYQAPGNVLPTLTLGPSQSTSNYVDFTSGAGGWVSCQATGDAAVGTPSGCRVCMHPVQDAPGDFDPTPLVEYVLAVSPSAVSARSIMLPPGKYVNRFTNLDAANSITVLSTAHPIT